MCRENFYLGRFLRAFIERWKPEETGEELPRLPGRLGEERVGSVGMHAEVIWLVLLRAEEGSLHAQVGWRPPLQARHRAHGITSTRNSECHISGLCSFSFVTKGKLAILFKPKHCPALSDQYYVVTHLPSNQSPLRETSNRKDSSMKILSPPHWLMADPVFTHILSRAVVM